MTPNTTIAEALRRKAEEADTLLAEQRKQWQKTAALYEWFNEFVTGMVTGTQYFSSPGVFARIPNLGRDREKELADGLASLRNELNRLFSRLPPGQDTHQHHAALKDKIEMVFLLGKLSTAGAFKELLMETARRMTTQQLCVALDRYFRIMDNDGEYEQNPVVLEGTENQRYEWARTQLDIAPSQWSVFRGWLALVTNAVAELTRRTHAQEFATDPGWAQGEVFQSRLAHRVMNEPE